MNATESLEYEQPCILNEVIEACNKEEVIDKHLQHVQSMSLCTSHIPLAEYMYTIIMAEMTKDSYRSNLALLPSSQHYIYTHTT